MEAKVTVYCLSFNHRQYIEKTLQGFVQQKTNFPFRVVVHDDASDDGTQELIKEYVQRYPSIFIGVYQKENQYSKNVNIYEKFIRPSIKSKYTAICEGDDYWCDENKLQLQYDYMEAHPSCALCVHNTEMIDEPGNSLGKFFNNNSCDKDYSARDVIERGPGGLFHTSSFFYRTDLRDKRPDAFRMKYVGDYPLAIYLSCEGNVHYFGRVMSKYRVGSVNSWVKNSSSNKKNQLLHLDNMISSLNKMDSFTGGKYHLQFDKVILDAEFEKSIYEVGLLNSLNNARYRKVFLHYSIKNKVKTVLKALKK